MQRESKLIAEAYFNRINENQHMQGIKLTTDTAMKTLIAQMFNDPDKFWELLKKVPGMYGALLTGNMKALERTFLSLGVDTRQIADVVAKSQELFDQYQRDPASVQIKKATAAYPLRATLARR